MHAIPKVFIDDCVVFAGIGIALVDCLAAIDPIVEKSVEVTLVDQCALLVAEP